MEGGVADGHRPLGERCAQRDGERLVVDDPEPAQLGRGRRGDDVVVLVGLGLQRLVAEHVGEEVRGGLRVRAVGRVVPGVDEGVGGHRSAVVEGPAALQRDGPGRAVRGRDGVGHAGVGDPAGVVVLHQPRPERRDDLATLVLRGVAGDQRVLGLADEHAEGAVVPGSHGRAVVGGRCTGRQQQRAGDPCGDERARSLTGSHVVMPPRPAGRQGNVWFVRARSSGRQARMPRCSRTERPGRRLSPGAAGGP